MPINTTPINAGSTAALDPNSAGNSADAVALRNGNPGGSFGSHLQHAASNAPDNAGSDSTGPHDPSVSNQSPSVINQSSGAGASAVGSTAGQPGSGTVAGAAGSKPQHAATAGTQIAHDSSDSSDQSQIDPAETAAISTASRTVAPSSTTAKGFAAMSAPSLALSATGATAGSAPAPTGKAGTVTGRNFAQRLTLVGRATQHALTGQGSATVRGNTTSASAAAATANTAADSTTADSTVADSTSTDSSTAVSTTAVSTTAVSTTAESTTAADATKAAVTAASANSAASQTDVVAATTSSAVQANAQTAVQAATTQVTLITTNAAAPTTKATSAAISTTGKQIATAGGSTTVSNTIAVAQPAFDAASSQVSDTTHLMSAGSVISPEHISLQDPTTSDESWSSTVISPQQPIAEVEAVTTTVATTTATIVETTAAGTTEVADDKTDSTASATASADVGPTTGATEASSNTATSQTVDGSATPSPAASNSVSSDASPGTSTGAGDSNSIASGVDRTRFVQRVARAFQTVGSGGGSIRLRLSPPELGSVRLEVSVKNGVLTAHAETETTQARDALVDNLPELRARLAEQNIQIDHFDVDLFDSSGGGTSNQSQDNGDTSPGFTPTAARSAIKPTGGAMATAMPSSAGVAGAVGVVDGGLNVVI